MFRSYHYLSSSGLQSEWSLDSLRSCRWFGSAGYRSCTNITFGGGGGFTGFEITIKTIILLFIIVGGVSTSTCEFEILYLIWRSISGIAHSKIWTQTVLMTAILKILLSIFWILIELYISNLFCTKLHVPILTIVAARHFWRLTDSFTRLIRQNDLSWDCFVIS